VPFFGPPSRPYPVTHPPAHRTKLRLVGPLLWTVDCYNLLRYLFKQSVCSTIANTAISNVFIYLLTYLPAYFPAHRKGSPMAVAYLRHRALDFHHNRPHSRHSSHTRSLHNLHPLQPGIIVGSLLSVAHVAHGNAGRRTFAWKRFLQVRTRITCNPHIITSSRDHSVQPYIQTT